MQDLFYFMISQGCHRLAIFKILDVIVPNIAKFFQKFGQNRQYFQTKFSFLTKKNQQKEKQDVHTNILTK